MADIFDQIAQKAEHAERACVVGADAIAYAKAFREHFAQRTCEHCQHAFLTRTRQRPTDRKDYIGCNKGIGWEGQEVEQPFSCSLWEPKT